MTQVISAAGVQADVAIRPDGSLIVTYKMPQDGPLVVRGRLDETDEWQATIEVGKDSTFPRLYVWRDTTWLAYRAYRDGLWQAVLRTVLDGTLGPEQLLGVTDGNNPVCFGNDWMAWQNRDAGVVYGLSLDSGETARLREETRPTGLAYLDAGRPVFSDENRDTVPGMFNPVKVSGCVVGEGPNGGLAVQLDERRGFVLLGECMTPRVADMGNGRYAAITWGDPGVRLVAFTAYDVLPAPAVAEAIDRPFIMAWYEFAIPDELPPGNVEIAVRRVYGERPRPVIVGSETDGRVSSEIYGYRVGNEGGPSLEQMERIAKEKATAGIRPIIYWDARRPPRWPTVPRGGFYEVMAYCGVNESPADFETAMQEVLFEASQQYEQLLLCCQCFTTNQSLTGDPAALVPIYVRLAREFPRVLGFTIFNDSGRDDAPNRTGGLTANPALRAVWQSAFDSVRGLPPLLPLERVTMQPRVTIVSYVPETGASPLLVKAVYAREADAGSITSLEWLKKSTNDSQWIVDAVNDPNDPDHTYTFPNGEWEIKLRAIGPGGVHETGRRRVVRVSDVIPSPAPTPQPPPTPTPEPTPAPVDPPWEAMVRETIRAVYEQDSRSVPSREDEDAILEKCYAPPRGSGWQLSHIEGYIRELPRPSVPDTPRVAFAGSIRRDGRFLVNDAGIFRPVFVSALSMLRPQRSDGDIRAYLDWATATGFNGVRTFAGALTWAGQTAEGARARLPFLLAEAKARGLYVEVTALTDTRAGGYDKREHVRACSEISVAAGNVLFEIANETFHSTQDDEVHDPEYLRRLADIPRSFGLLCAIGAPEFDEPQLIDPSNDSKGAHFPFPVADYVTLHLDRGRDKWNMVRRVRELEAASAVTGRPVLNNEPIGADELDGSVTGRQRINDPNIFYTMGLLNRLKEVGGLHHSQAGAQAELPGPVQQACAEAFVAGSRLIPTEDRLTFKNARWADSPIADADFNAVIRAYSGVSGDRAWTALVGLSGDPRLRMGNGWRIVGTIADRPGVQVVELAR